MEDEQDYILFEKWECIYNEYITKGEREAAQHEWYKMLVNFGVPE